MEILSILTILIITIVSYSYLREKFNQKGKIPFDSHLNF